MLARTVSSSANRSPRGMEAVPGEGADGGRREDRAVEGRPAPVHRRVMTARHLCCPRHDAEARTDVEPGDDGAAGAHLDGLIHGVEVAPAVDAVRRPWIVRHRHGRRHLRDEPPEVPVEPAGGIEREGGLSADRILVVRSEAGHLLGAGQSGQVLGGDIELPLGVGRQGPGRADDRQRQAGTTRTPRCRAPGRR